MKVLICGGGIAGPALAFWLARLGYDVTVVERFPGPRRSGLQVHVRGPGAEILGRMGLERAVRSRAVDEAGVQFVDRTGRQKAYFSTRPGPGAPDARQYEILRSDLADLVYDATRHSTKYLFGVHVASLDQDADAVAAHFSDGTRDVFDLVVGADGQDSHVRHLIRDPEAPDPFRPLGVHSALFTIPRPPDVPGTPSVCHVPRRRVLATRGGRDADGAEVLHVYLAALPPAERDKKALAAALRGGVAEQKRVWAEHFADAGPFGDAVVAALRRRRVRGDDDDDASRAAATDDDGFFAQVFGQVKLGSWSRGRVVLLGDAAWCSSPLSDAGTTAALVGAYVLAGELAEAGGGLQGEVVAALQAYEERLRPVVEQVQRLKPRALKIGMPDTAVGISLLHLALGLTSCLRDKKGKRAAEDFAWWTLPEYPDLCMSDG